MVHNVIRTLILSVLILGVANAGGVVSAQFAMPTQNYLTDPLMESNSLLDKWSGPYGGIPPFDKIKVADFKPALEAAMVQNLSEIDKIADNSEAPTFENTIAAMERSGKALARV